MPLPRVRPLVAPADRPRVGLSFAPSHLAPVVDIRNNSTQSTIPRETLTAIPTTGRMGQYAALIAGATLETSTLQDVDGRKPGSPVGKPTSVEWV